MALGGNSYGLTTTFDNAPNGRLDWYWNASSSGTALTDNYIGSSPGGNVAVLFNTTNSAVYVRVKSQNTTGSSAYSAYVQLVTQTPPATINPLSWNDSRLVYWIRTSQNNAAIISKATTQLGRQAFFTAQTSPDIDFSLIAEPRTQPDPANGNAPRLVFGRGGVGTSDEGWFKHRIWNGMPQWDGGGGDLRLRSSIVGPVPSGLNGPFVLGQEYWYAFGFKLQADMFASTDSSPDYYLSLGG